MSTWLEIDNLACQGNWFIVVCKLLQSLFVKGTYMGAFFQSFYLLPLGDRHRWSRSRGHLMLLQWPFRSRPGLSAVYLQVSCEIVDD